MGSVARILLDEVNTHESETSMFTLADGSTEMGLDSRPAGSRFELQLARDYWIGVHQTTTCYLNGLIAYHKAVICERSRPHPPVIHTDLL
jgi:hypothetical protein